VKKNEILELKQERQKAVDARRIKTETCRLFFSPLSQPPKRTVATTSRYVE
jgi:hypothetical protein